MKAKFVTEAFKDVFQPRSKEEIEKNISPLFLEAYKKADKIWDLLKYSGGTLATNSQTRELFFGFHSDIWIFQITPGNKDELEIIISVFHSSEFRNATRYILNSFEELQDLVKEYSNMSLEKHKERKEYNN